MSMEKFFIKNKIIKEGMNSVLLFYYLLLGEV